MRENYFNKIKLYISSRLCGYVGNSGSDTGGSVLA